MCGILGSVVAGDSDLELAEVLCLAREGLVSRRGPDGVDAVSPETGVVVAAAVLRMRKNALEDWAQPAVDESCVLVWNGEWYETKDAGSPRSQECDTRCVLRLMSRAAAGATSPAEAQWKIAEAFAKEVRGEYAFLAYLPAWRLLVFARDPLGRRSLVFTTTTTTLTTPESPETSSPETSSSLGDRASRLMVASTAVTKDETWREVPPTGVQGFVFSGDSIESLPEAPWPLRRRRDLSSPRYALLEEPEQRRQWAASAFEAALSEATRRRVVGAGRVCVLFSGGIDSAVLALLAHRHCDKSEAIELVNVAFGASRHQCLAAPDRLAARRTLKELKIAAPHRDWRLVEVDVSPTMLRRSARRIVALTAPKNTHMDFNIAAALRHAAHGVGRLFNDDDKDKDEIVDLSQEEKREEPLLRYGVEVPHVLKKELVAGTCPRSYARGGGKPASACTNRRQPKCALGLCGNCCRREGGCRVHPRRLSPEEKIQRSIKKREKEAFTRRQDSKSDSSSDDDAFLKDAFHDEGFLEDGYGCVARVLLLGMGADELLAGYARHRTAWRRGGKDSLQEELDLDFNRIGHRNLGRDDRVTADAGREARYPFLDEDVVKLTRETLDIADIADLDLPPGVGCKKLLRDLARRLGLTDTAALQKRAIQFGTRIATHSNRLAFGSNRKADGAATFSIDSFLDKQTKHRPQAHENN